MASDLSGADRPRWRDVERTLRDDILSGAIGPDHQLPGELQLAERFGVSRPTARRALASLQQQGLIRIERGRGSFVQSDVVPFHLGKRTRFSQSLKAGQHAPTRKLIKARRLGADRDLAEHLELDVGAPVIELEMLGEADGLPVVHGYDSYAEARFPGIDDALRQKGSITATLKLYGVDDYFRCWTRLTTRHPTEYEARVLKQPTTVPLIAMRRLDVDRDGKPVSYAHGTFSGLRVELFVEP